MATVFNKKKGCAESVNVLLERLNNYRGNEFWGDVIEDYDWSIDGTELMTPAGENMKIAFASGVRVTIDKKSGKWVKADVIDMDQFNVTIDGRSYGYVDVFRRMDRDTRVQVLKEVVPCSNQEVVDAYCKRHKEVFGQDFNPGE
jgi:hypothetical protein